MGVVCDIEADLVIQIYSLRLNLIQRSSNLEARESPHCCRVLFCPTNMAVKMPLHQLQAIHGSYKVKGIFTCEIFLCDGQMG